MFRQKLIAFTLLVGSVFQLGACPCGCLEHNLWIQLIGIDADHTHNISESTSGDVHNAEDHDCTGEPRTQYVDNSRSLSTTGKFIRNTQWICEVDAGHVCQAQPSFADRFHLSVYFAFARAQNIAKLQVYLL